jgi:DNA repair exonuclease SbcCD nuclease subunit
VDFIKIAYTCGELMRILRIGDPHIKPNNLDEAENLLHFINDVILEQQPDRIEILGDLFHTHAIVRLEVLEFWVDWIDVLLTHEIPLYVLRGNHDMATSEEYCASVYSVFKLIKNRNFHYCDSPRADQEIDGPFAYISYYSDHDKFIEIANHCAKEGAKVLVCHQTFDGSRYESGIFAPDGIDTSKINFNLIISGHIHTHQDMIKGDKRILYPGTPKWDTASDANEDKGIWMYEHDDSTGAILKEELIRTAHVVTKIVSLTWIEGMDLPAIPSGCKVTIELIGSSKWVESQKAALKGTVEIRSKVTDKTERRVREAGKNFPDFVANKFQTDMNKIELLKYMKGLGIV